MKTILTKEGRDKLQDELNFLITVEQNRVISELAEARDDDSIEENTQYMAVKSEYEKLLDKIEKLRHKLSHAIIVDSADVKTDKVAILTTVKILNTSKNQEMVFKIVPDNEVDVKSGKISVGSPIGAGLLGKKINDICSIKTPSGEINFKILDISI